MSETNRDRSERPSSPSGLLGRDAFSARETDELNDPFLPAGALKPTPPRVQWFQNNKWQYGMSELMNDEDLNRNHKYSPVSLETLNTRPPLVPTRFTRIFYPFRKGHPLSERYESPSFFLFFLHTLFCCTTYPALRIAAFAATFRSLFVARVIVGFGCSLMGFSLSYTLVGLTQALIEAATWATLIDQSIGNVSEHSQDSGIRLQDFCVQANEPKSVYSAIMLLLSRWKNRKSKPGTYYDRRLWSGYVLLFVFSVLLSAALSFIFGRTVDIATISQRQYNIFDEVSVAGDLSADDLSRAARLAPVFTENRLFTWTIEAFSRHGAAPPPRSFSWRNDTVYFAEVTQSELTPGGSGFGTFDWDDPRARTQASTRSNPVQDISNQDVPQDADMGIDPGAIVIFPRWGLRTHCERIPNLEQNMIVFSENQLTYLFTPRDIVKGLFQSFGLPIPPMVDKPLNVEDTLEDGDTIPPSLNVSSFMIGVPYWSNGVSNNVKSTYVSTGEDGTGFASLENVLIRLNSKYAPNATFPFRDSEDSIDANGTASYVGFDAAICLQLIERWIVDVYNSSTGSPTTMYIRAKVNADDWKSSPGWIGVPNTVIMDPTAKRMLNSSGYTPAFIAAHENSVNQVAKDNGRDSFYVPSPSLISFTNGSGPFGYTEFSADLYAKARSLSDASNALPYFSGSGKLVARHYQDRVIATASVRNFDLAMALGLVFMTGLLCTVAVPRLPFGVPKRGFNLYSWILAFYANEVEIQGGEKIVPGMGLDELQQHAGDVILRYRLVDRHDTLVTDH